jgi:hypothetical protein
MADEASLRTASVLCFVDSRARAAWGILKRGGEVAAATVDIALRCQLQERVKGGDVCGYNVCYAVQEQTEDEDEDDDEVRER